MKYVNERCAYHSCDLWRGILLGKESDRSENRKNKEAGKTQLHCCFFSPTPLPFLSILIYCIPQLDKKTKLRTVFEIKIWINCFIRVCRFHSRVKYTIEVWHKSKLCSGYSKNHSNVSSVVLQTTTSQREHISCFWLSKPDKLWFKEKIAIFTTKVLQLALSFRWGHYKQK